MRKSKSADFMFESEKILVDVFVSHLRSELSPWGNVQIATEFYYQRDRTDVVAHTEDDFMLAFEAKLQDWREALHQAYRNRCFAHRSYVVLPKSTALSAFRFRREFERRRVGICYVDGFELVVLHEASETDPVQPWLLDQAKAHCVPPALS